MGDLIQLLRDLIASGQFGVIIIALVVVIAGAVFVIWIQRQTTARFDSLTKAIELNMQSADTAREQSIAAQKEIASVQKEVRETLEKQFDIVTKANDELRKELERYKSDQARFEREVKQSISIGIDELKASLSKVTVAEIVSQIPEGFRQDLEKEMKQAADRTIRSVLDKLREADSIAITDDELLRRIVERAVQATINQFIPPQIREEYEYYMRREGRLPPEFYRRHGSPTWLWDERAIDFLAERIAERLRRW